MLKTAMRQLLKGQSFFQLPPGICPELDELRTLALMNNPRLADAQRLLALIFLLGLAGDSASMGTAMSSMSAVDAIAQMALNLGFKRT